MMRFEVSEGGQGTLPAIDLADERVLIGSGPDARLRLPASVARTAHVRIADGKWAALADVVVDGKPRAAGESGTLGETHVFEIGSYRIRATSAPTDAPASTPQRTESIARELVRAMLGSGAAPSFEIERGPDRGSIRALPPPEATVVIGRGDDADWVILDEDLSRAHAEVRRGWDGVTIRDRGSKNGTLVNGVPAPPEGAPLRDGATITMGNVVLRFRDPAEAHLVGDLTPAMPPPPREPTPPPIARTKTIAPVVERPPRPRWWLLVSSSTIAALAFAALAYLLAGCDRVFGVAAPLGDASSDALDADVRIDRDEDGIFDDVDNCPDGVNPSQHDEDRDGTGDICDMCPHVEGANGDTDLDGVGDVCDPDSQSATEELLAFDAFEIARSYPCPSDPLAGLACTYPGQGMVAVANDALNIVGPEQFVVESFATVPRVRSLDTTVEAMPTTDDANFVLLIARAADDVSSNYMSCGVVRNQMTGNADINVFRLRNSIASARSVPISTWPPPPRLTLRFEVPATADEIITCRVRWANGTQAATISLPIADRPATYGVWTYEMTAAFEYLAVVVAR